MREEVAECTSTRRPQEKSTHLELHFDSQRQADACEVQQREDAQRGETTRCDAPRAASEVEPVLQTLEASRVQEACGECAKAVEHGADHSFEERHRQLDLGKGRGSATLLGELRESRLEEVFRSR